MADYSDFDYGNTSYIGSEDEERDAYLAGQKAAARGQGLEDNPFDKKNLNFMYNCGWHYATRFRS